MEITMTYRRSAEGEARRVAALRSPEVRARISAAKKGKTPKNFENAQAAAWASNRKETLSYSGIHAWVKRNWGVANACEHCKRENLSGRAVHWANLDHAYTRDRAAWAMLCRTCHAAHDAAHNGTDFRRKDMRQ